MVNQNQPVHLRVHLQVVDLKYVEPLHRVVIPKHYEVRLLRKSHKSKLIIRGYNRMLNMVTNLLFHLVVKDEGDCEENHSNDDEDHAG